MGEGTSRWSISCGSLLGTFQNPTSAWQQLRKGYGYSFNSNTAFPGYNIWKTAYPRAGKGQERAAKPPLAPPWDPITFPEPARDQEKCPWMWEPLQTPPQHLGVGYAARNNSGLERGLLLQLLGGESQHGSCQRKPSFTTNNTSKGSVYNYSINWSLIYFFSSC